LPLEGTHFVDISTPALMKLRERGAQVVLGQIGSLPFADGAFDLVCALDVIEHVGDDQVALSELSRVTKLGGTLVLSAPLHISRWTAFDDFVGHKRRYDPSDLIGKLAQNQLVVERSAVYGMQPRSTQFVDIGMWCLKHHRERALWWYNKLLMPLALRFQKQLKLAPGMIALDAVDEILMVCRRDSRRNWRLGSVQAASSADPPSAFNSEHADIVTLRQEAATPVFGSLPRSSHCLPNIET
jgi:SAM-dependent methyltransferase